jgi:hypothetical protein
MGEITRFFDLLLLVLGLIPGTADTAFLDWKFFGEVIFKFLKEII